MKINEPQSRGYVSAAPVIPAGLQVQVLTEQAEEAFSQFLKEEARMEFLNGASTSRTRQTCASTPSANTR